MVCVKFLNGVNFIINSLMQSVNVLMILRSVALLEFSVNNLIIFYANDDVI